MRSTSKACFLSQTAYDLEVVTINVNNLHKRPFGITIVVVLADIGALFRLIGCIIVIVATFATASRVPGGARAVIVGISIFWGTIAVGVLFVGHFLWRGANWARITFIVILLAGLALTVVGMLLWGVDVESFISIELTLVCLGILTIASAKAYCPPAGVQGRSARIVVAGILNVCYGTLGYLILAFPTLLAWAIAASRSSKAAVFTRMHMLGSIDTSLLLLLQIGIATVNDHLLASMCLLRHQWDRDFADEGMGQAHGMCRGRGDGDRCPGLAYNRALC